MKIGHQVGLGFKVQGSRFRVNRFAFFPITIDSIGLIQWGHQPLNREPFNPTLVLKTEPFVQNITPKYVQIYEI